MKRRILFFLLASMLIPAAAYSYYYVYPVGGTWEYSGRTAMVYRGRNVDLYDTGRIVIDTDYEYDWWYDDYDEWIEDFRARGTISVRGHDDFDQAYVDYRRIRRWYDFRDFWTEANGTRYYLTNVGEYYADLEIIRFIDGLETRIFCVAHRIRWDDDWDDDDWNWGLSGGGCRTGSSPAALLLLLPGLLLFRRK
jgi:Synergist-CTERM protein sorting domain-containing protein